MISYQTQTSECWYILDFVNWLLLKDDMYSLKNYPLYIDYDIPWKWSPIRRVRVGADTSSKICEWQNGKREIEPFIFSIRHGVFSMYILGTNVPTNEYSYSWRFNQAINRIFSPHDRGGVEVDLLAWRNFENWSFERTLT